MHFVSAAELIATLDFPSLVATLDDAFRAPAVAPMRQHYTMQRTGEPDAILLTMPAWSDTRKVPARDAVIGVKLVTAVPGNSGRGVATVQGSYVLMSGLTGSALAVLDGTMLTWLRTAAASALASRYLSRPDANRLVMVGAGSLAPFLIAAHAAVRPIREVTIWNHNPDRAAALAARLQGRPYAVTAADDLGAAIGAADIVSAATMSRQPLVLGAMLKPGTHVDLVGAYTPEMRESDDAAVARASLFADTRAGVLHEAGDVVLPIASGAITADAICADLYDLAGGTHPGRASAGEITLFKSVGIAIEDLAAAKLAWDRLKPA